MIGSECGGSCERADIVGNPNLPSNRPLAQRLSEWFNPAAFTYNAIGTFGNSPRNFLIGPNYADVDLGLVKSFPIKIGPFAETQQIDFRAEFFNLFNRANFNNLMRQSPMVQLSEQFSALTIHGSSNLL